jgi:hypothetical protein
MQQMSLSLVKHEIMENMLLSDKAARAPQIAKEIGREFPSVMMHILGLIRMGYAYSPEKGHYALTERGKQAIGVPEVNKEKAKAITEPVSITNAFQFYSDIGKPLGICAVSLQDFSEKILSLDTNAIDFHMKRGDFEAWFTGIGDLELAKKAAILKEKKVGGTELLRKLHGIVDNRYRALASLANQTSPST